MKSFCLLWIRVAVYCFVFAIHVKINLKKYKSAWVRIKFLLFAIKSLYKCAWYSILTRHANFFSFGNPVGKLKPVPQDRNRRLPPPSPSPGVGPRNILMANFSVLFIRVTTLDSDIRMCLRLASSSPEQKTKLKFRFYPNV